MVEKMQADSAINPEQHLQALNGMIAAGLGAGPVNAGGDAFIDGVLASAAGPVVSMFVGLADGIGGSNQSGVQSHHGQTSSFFVPAAAGKKPGKGQSSQNQSRFYSLMPEGGMSYSDKKRLAGMSVGASKLSGGSQDLVGSARVASMSLTGSSLVGGRRRPIKGAKMSLPKDPQKLRNMGLLSREMCDEIDVTLKTMQGTNRYNSTKRLSNDTARGTQQAKKYNTLKTGGSV